MEMGLAQHFVRLHKFHVAVCVKLGWQCVAVALEYAPHRLLKALVCWEAKSGFARP